MKSRTCSCYSYSWECPIPGIHFFAIFNRNNMNNKNGKSTYKVTGVNAGIINSIDTPIVFLISRC